MSWKRKVTLVVVITLLALMLPLSGPASASIIDDKSDFVGDFTVIDFETWADGTPLVLDEGDLIEIADDEYADLGVTITSSVNIWGNERAFVGNDRSPQSDAAQALVGSLPNKLFHATGVGSIRFDFQVSVNAIGMAAQNRTDGALLSLQVYDENDSLIELVAFNGIVVDGTLLGSDYGNAWDLEYGFFGFFSPSATISYGVVTVERGSIDDLHFGVIPEPTTLAFLVLAGLVIVRTRRRRLASR